MICKAINDKRKYHGAVDKPCSLEQQFCKSNVITFLYEETGAVALTQPGLKAAWLAGSQADEMLLSLKILNLYCYWMKYWNFNGIQCHYYYH